MLLVDSSISSYILDLSEFLAVCGSMLSIGVTSSNRHRFNSWFLAVLQPASDSFICCRCFLSFLPNRLPVFYSAELGFIKFAGFKCSDDSFLTMFWFLVELEKIANCCILWGRDNWESVSLNWFWIKLFSLILFNIWLFTGGFLLLGSPALSNSSRVA